MSQSPARYSALAGSSRTARREAVAAVYRLTEELNIPTLHELGFDESEIPFLAEIAERDPQTIGNPRDVDRRGYETIWRRAFACGRFPV